MDLFEDGFGCVHLLLLGGGDVGFNVTADDLPEILVARMAVRRDAPAEEDVRMRWSVSGTRGVAL